MEENKAEKKAKNFKMILRISVVLLALAIMLFVIKIAPNYKKDEFADKTNLVINNNNITRNLKADIIIEDDAIYICADDVKNFFDEYLLVENDEKRVITTSNTKTVVIPFTGTTMYVSGKNENISHEILQKNEKIYLPMSDLTKIYNIDIKYSESTDVVTVDSFNRKFVTANSKKNTGIKYKATSFSKNVDKVKQGDTLVVVQDKEGNKVKVKDYVQVRTLNGKLGYIKETDIENESIVRETEYIGTKMDGKVSLVWDYYSQYVTAPSRSGEIEGVNVVSPAFYEVTASGDLNRNIGVEGQAYVEWAHANGYKVWPMVSNSELGSLDATSKILSKFETRAYLIENIVKDLIDAKVDGVNIDFENMYKADNDNYSRFLIELAPRLRENGLALSVDVTAPDGSETWSLCFNRNIIGKVADYIIYMGYDQNGVASTKPGTVAGADWVELNIKKFLGQEGVDKNKLILAIPFYTRLWKETDATLTSSVVNMKSVIVPEGVEKKWDENTKQYYIEYQANNATYKMWIEDTESIKAKLDLINQYDLAGAGFWSKDREDNSVWSIIAETLNI